MNYVEEQLIVDHLQVLCIAEHVRPSRLLIEKIVKDCNRDIRKSILKLQFTCEQWIKPCYTAMDRVIKDFSIVDLTSDPDKKESTDDANPVQDSKSMECEGAGLQSREIYSTSLVSVNESGKPDELDHNEQVETFFAAEVVSCMSQALVSSKGLKMQDLDPKAIHTRNSIHYELDDLKSMETEGKEVDLPRDSCETRAVHGELKSEVSTPEFKTADKDATSVDKKEISYEVTPAAMEESSRKEEVLEEVPMIAVVDDISCNEKDQNCLFDIKKASFIEFS